MENTVLENIGERVDRLITLDVRGRGPKCPVMEKLYPAARKRYNKPICTYAAEELNTAVRDGDYVFIVTGLNCFGMGLETDGPVGAVSLGRALQTGLGARPIFITMDAYTEMLEKTAIGGGFLVFSSDKIQQAWSSLPSAAFVEGFPIDRTECQNKAKKLVSAFKPKAIIAIEARGSNREGVYHIVNGSDITANEAKMDYLFHEAKKKNILTIGIFDGCGHEIGFGTLGDDVVDDYPRYAECLCGCESGMHDSTSVDIAVPAATSNWGAYGIEACLSALLENSEVLHNTDLEYRMLRMCADAGVMDGTTGRSELAVDGLPLKIQTAIVDILREIVKGHLRGYAPELKKS